MRHHWHDGLQGHALIPKQFPVIRVTEHAQELVLDLEQSYFALAAASPDNRSAVEDAYSGLSQRKKDLFEYLAALEENAASNVTSDELRQVFKRTVILRFD